MQQYRRNPGIETAPLDEEAILFNPAANRFVVMNSTGGFIWGLLDEARSADHLARAVCDQFAQVSFPDALRDVENILAQMESQNLIIREGESSA
jgi:hypothetical protein